MGRNVEILMGLDYGDRTVGVAASDLLLMTAQGVETIRRTSNKDDLRRLGELVAQYEATTFVIGLPKNMDGTEGSRAQLCRAFADRLHELTGLETVMWDERRTTVDAHRILTQAGKHGKKRKQVVDAVAASLILEGYLEYLNKSC